MRPPWQQPMPHCPLYPATNRWPDLWMVNEWRRTHNNNIIYVYESPELHPPIETRLPACLHFIFNLLIELHPKTKLHLFLVAIGISKYRYTVYTNVNPYVKLLTKIFAISHCMDLFFISRHTMPDSFPKETIVKWDIFSCTSIQTLHRLCLLSPIAVKQSYL